MPTPLQHLNIAAKQKAYRARQAQVRNQEQLAKGMPRAAPISTMPSPKRWNAQIELARVALETVQQEMQDYHADRSELWQESEKGADFLQRVEAIEEMLQQFDTLTG